MASRAVEIGLVAVTGSEEAEELCRQLTSRGWQVLSAYNGAVALAACGSERVMLLVVSTDLLRGKSERAPAARPTAFLPLSPQSPDAFLRTVQGRPGPPPDASAKGATEGRPGIAVGTPVQLWSQAGALAGGCSALVTEVGSSFLRVASEVSADCLQRVSLGTPVRVSFASSRGPVEVMSQVAGLAACGSETEVTLSLSEPMVHHQRRHWPRAEARVPVRAWPTAHPDRAGVMVAGQIVDIGQGGVGAGFLAPLPSAQYITLAIDTGEGRELRVRARVVWHQPPAGSLTPVTHRYGFQFVNVVRGTRTRLRALVSRLDPALGVVAPSLTAVGPPFRKRSRVRKAAEMGPRNGHAHLPTH